MDLENERSKLQQQVLSEKHRYEQKVSELESQIAALQTAWEFDKTAAQHKIVSTETVEWGTQVFTEWFEADGPCMLSGCAYSEFPALQ